MSFNIKLGLIDEPTDLGLRLDAQVCVCVCVCLCLCVCVFVSVTLGPCFGIHIIMRMFSMLQPLFLTNANV